MAESGADDSTDARLSDLVPAPSPTVDALVALRADLGQRAELKALDDLRQRAWRHDVEQRIEMAYATLPESAGPLNSQGLVAKALTAFDQRTPGYLKHLASYLDTLLWLEEQS